MNKGYLYSLESIVLFIAWMVLLASAWSFSQTKVEYEKKAWEREEKEEQLVKWSDTLVLQHHITPWMGCASYSQEKRRVLPYVLERTCLETLSQTHPPFPVSRVEIRTTIEKIILYKNEMQNRECVEITRPIILDGKENAVMRMSACEP